MTRDEAIKIYQDAVGRSGGHFLDGLAALGILKLDEPVSKIAAIDSIIRRHADPKVADCIMGAIKNAKLLIGE